MSAAQQQVEAGAAGHGNEPRGKRTDAGEATYLIAVAEALWEEMERDGSVYLLGEDIGVYGGAFKVTEGFIERFGPERVMDTPICEETIMGMAIGSAMEGMRPVAEVQYADFIANGFDELVNVAGKYHYRSGVPLPMVVRGPSGGGVRASAFHSQNPEPWFAHTPGLKVMCPAFPSDAKGLLKAAIRDDNPCLFFEHKWIYRRIREVVSEDPDFTVPIGSAMVRREGNDLTIVTYGAMVHRALDAAEELEQKGVSVEVVDLRTINPLDEEGVLKSVEKTSRALVLYESHRFLGVGAEVAATIAERAFQHLDAPVARLAPPNTPVPFSPSLEDAYLPQVADIERAVDELASW
jgi:pyruvate/2-oxoglutarate/acetoin dehydrogenase E1 component